MIFVLEGGGAGFGIGSGDHCLQGF